MLLRKQTSYNQTFHVRMKFKPTARGYEAGVVLWWSQFSYAAMGVEAVEDENGNVVAKTVRRGPNGKLDGFQVSTTANMRQHPSWHF